MNQEDINDLLHKSPESKGSNGQFNNLTAPEHERLSILLEELGEVQQAIGKILRHGYESYNPFDERKTSNRRSLEKELGDVRYAISMLTDCGDLSEHTIEEMKRLKNMKIGKWLHHQK
jgi:NTP pyrophosphatase (non-canonical NTP hydrolase)